MSGCDWCFESLKQTVPPSFASPEDLCAVFSQCDANKCDQELNGSPGYFDRLVADGCFRKNTDVGIHNARCDTYGCPDSYVRKFVAADIKCLDVQCTFERGDLLFERRLRRDASM